MINAIFGKKIGMTQLFEDDGTVVPVTVIQAEPNQICQIKTAQTEGYEAVQLAFDEKKEKRTTKAMKGHFAKAGTTPKKRLVEFKDFGKEVTLGEVIDVNIFIEGEYCDVSGTSKGKGFQGVVKRHGFGGVNDKTHGQHNRLRAPGSLGACSTPSRVFKGMRMGGRMGGDSVKVTSLRVLKVIPESNLLIVKGSVPGAKGSYLIIER